jgi:hypothetical protein
MNQKAQTVLARSALVEIVNKYGLYPGMEAKTSLEKVLAEMREGIRIEPITGGQRTVEAVSIQFR